MSNGDYHRVRGLCASDSAEVVREREDGPPVRDCAEVGVLRIGELAVVEELGADDDVFACLVRCA